MVKIHVIQVEVNGVIRIDVGGCRGVDGGCGTLTLHLHRHPGDEFPSLRALSPSSREELIAVVLVVVMMRMMILVLSIDCLCRCGCCC